MATSWRVEQADRAPAKPGPSPAWVGSSQALLSGVGGYEEIEAAERSRAARAVVRLAFGRHDCPRLADETAECGPEHAVAAADALTALQVLGLAPEDPALRRKKCSTCKVSKPLDEFPADPSAALGVHAVCRLCQQAQRRRREAKKAMS